MLADSVAEMELQLKARPNDIELRADLAQALVDRHMFGEDAHPAGSDEDIERLIEVVAGLSEDVAFYQRDYFVYNE